GDRHQGPSGLTGRDRHVDGGDGRPPGEVVAATAGRGGEATAADGGGTRVELNCLGVACSVENFDVALDRCSLRDVVDDVDLGPWVVLAVDGRIEQADAD